MPMGKCVSRRHTFRSVLRSTSYTFQRRLSLEDITFDSLSSFLRTMVEHFLSRLTLGQIG